MKKTIRKSLFTIALAVILAFTLMFSAFAASFEHIADALSDLGLLQGTGSGYELDRAPNRDEAITMLIRFLGKADEAESNNFEHPFTDVPAWADAAVGYAFVNGLTKGVTDTEFGSKVPCSAQMYVTFMLRALGYEEGEDGDFIAAGAIDFGKEIGIIDDLLISGAFLRDQMVAVSYLALGAATKHGGGDTLLDELIAAGVVGEEDASAAKALFALYGEFKQVGAELEEVTSIAMTILMDMNMGFFGEMSACLDLSVIIDGTDILGAIAMDIDLLGVTGTMELYIADGYVYIDDGEEKIKMSAGLEDLESLLASADLSRLTLNPVYYFSSITKSSEDGYTVYSIRFADSFFTDIMGMAMGMMGDTGLGDFGMGGMTFDLSAINYYADSEGALKKITISMGMVLSVEEEGVSMTIPLSLDLEMIIIATGDDVTVTLPDDLDEYVESEMPGLW